MQRTQLAHSHPPLPLEGSITSNKQPEMGTTGLVCWRLPPKYAILLPWKSCSWQFHSRYYLLAGPYNLPTTASGHFLTLTMAKTKNKTENPETSPKILHPGKHSFPRERVFEPIALSLQLRCFFPEEPGSALAAMKQILGCPRNPYPGKVLIEINGRLVKDGVSLGCERCTNIFILLKCSHLRSDKGKRDKNGTDMKRQDKIRKKKM